MPLSELHKKKAKKNYAVLAIIFALIALFFAITLIKIGNNKSEKAKQAITEHTKNCYVTGFMVNGESGISCTQIDMNTSQIRL